jgi:hypothetical protein
MLAMVAVASWVGSALGLSLPRAFIWLRPSHRWDSQRSSPFAIAIRASGLRSVSCPASDPIGQPPTAWRSI